MISPWYVIGFYLRLHQTLPLPIGGHMKKRIAEIELFLMDLQQKHCHNTTINLTTMVVINVSPFHEKMTGLKQTLALSLLFMKLQGTASFQSD